MQDHPNTKQFSPVDLLTSPKQYVTAPANPRQPPSQNQSFAHYQPHIKIKQPLAPPAQLPSHAPDETDFWKNRSHQLERQLGQLTNELNQLRSNPDRITYVEDTQKQAELERAVHQQAQHIERLNLELNNCRHQLSNPRQDLHLAQEYDKLKHYLLQTEQRYQAEIKNLNDQLAQYHHLLSQLQQKEQHNEQNHSQQLNTLKNDLDKTTSRSQTLQDDLALARQRISTLETRNQELMQKEKSATYQLERQIRESADVKDRLEHEIEARREENRKLYNVNQALQSAFQETSKCYEQDYSKAYAEEVQQLKKKLKQKSDELEKCQANLNYLEGQVVHSGEVQAKYECAKAECERAEQKLKAKSRENEQLRNCIGQLELAVTDDKHSSASHDTKFVNLENKVSLLTSEIERLHQALEKKQRDLDALRAGGSSNNDQLRVENERLNNLLSQKMDEIDRLRRDAGRNTNSNTDDKVELLNREVDSWKQQFIVLNKEYHKCQERLFMVQSEMDSRHRPGHLKELDTNHSTSFGHPPNVDNFSLESLCAVSSNRRHNIDRI